METGLRLARDWFRFDLSLPVLMKEMRSRMRGTRAPVLLFITTGLTILVGLLIVAPQWDGVSGGYPGGQSEMAEIGKALFIGMLILEGIVCGLIAPALTAGAISIEREQQTLDLLILTRLSSANIVLGKLLSSLGFLVVVLICALPVMAISFVLGGVDPGQMTWALLLILVTVTLFGAIALYCSTRYTKTATAVAVAYCLCLLWMAVVPVFVGLFEMMYSNTQLYTHDVSYLVFAVASSAVIALIPAGALSIIVGTFFRRPLSRLANLILWIGMMTGCATALVIVPEAIHDVISSSTEMAFLGNPIAGMVVLIAGSEIFSARHSTFLAQYYVPITVAIIAFCAWLVIAQTIREFNRLRR